MPTLKRNHSIPECSGTLTRPRGMPFSRGVWWECMGACVLHNIPINQNIDLYAKPCTLLVNASAVASKWFGILQFQHSDKTRHPFPWSAPPQEFNFNNGRK